MDKCAEQIEKLEIIVEDGIEYYPHMQTILDKINEIIDVVNLERGW